MASKARKERRRLEQMIRRRDQLTALADQVQSDIAELLTGQRPEPVRVEVPDLSDDVPLLIERQAVETANNGQSYEEANWAKLSPSFRAAHNRLRIARGMTPIPPPKIDLYRPPAVVRPSPKEVEALSADAGAAATEFLSGGKKGVGPRLMAPGREGFTINGEPAKY